MHYRLDIIQRLHARLLEIIATALPLITVSMSDADLIGLAHLRGEMVDAIRAYCQHIHVLRATTSPGCGAVDADVLDQLTAGCVSLNEAYDLFCTRWSDRRAENWYEYRLSAIVMMKQVRNLVRTAQRRVPPPAWSQPNLYVFER